MNRKLILPIILSLALACPLPAAYIADAKIVTEVLGWGETVTGVRLEYSEEIRGDSIKRNNDPLKPLATLTYDLDNGREINAVYVNNSGKKGEASPYGRYVFIDFCQEGANWTRYTEYVAFDAAAKTRPESEAVYISQREPVVTKDGETAEPQGILTSGELRLGIDDFTTFLYTGDLVDDDTLFYCHLYIPEGYEEKKEGLDDLPLILHFPSSDVTYDDYSGLYYGALFSHSDAIEWVREEAQEEHPAFLLSYGSNQRVRWHGDIYAEVVGELLEKYNIDPSRIYGIGLAAGSNALWEAAFGHPDLFAGIISVSFEFAKVYGDEEAAENAAKLFRTAPAWVFVGEDDFSATAQHPDDSRVKGPLLRSQVEELEAMGLNLCFADGEDMWNGLLSGSKAEKQAEAQIARAEESGADGLVTLFLANTLRVNGHCAWTSVYTNRAVRNWLFEQASGKPYTP